MTTLKRITLTLFIVILSITSSLILLRYQPWRYLKILRQDEVLLHKDPFTSPGLFIVEAPDLDLTLHVEYLSNDLPFLYTNLPKDLPKEVTLYLEQRNDLIRDISMNDKIMTTHKEIIHVFPFQHQDQKGFILVTKISHYDCLVSLYDTSFNFVTSKEINKIWKTVISANFTDRFWFSYVYAGATGGCHYFSSVFYRNDQFVTSSVSIGCSYDFEVDPYNTMKIINVSSNPELKTHILRPYDLEETTCYNNPLFSSFTEKIMTVYFNMLILVLLLSIPFFLLLSLILISSYIILRIKKYHLISKLSPNEGVNP